jgi:hypothetical protein
MLNLPFNRVLIVQSNLYLLISSEAMLMSKLQEKVNFAEPSLS